MGIFQLISVLTLWSCTLIAAAQPADTTAAAKGMPAGMDIYKLAKVATSQHYPLPDEVMFYQKQLTLTAAQLSRMTAIIKTLNLKKAEISQSVTLNERTLQKLFATRKAQESNLIFYGNRYGLYEGEMRTAVLVACTLTARVLTPLQINRFEQLQKNADE